jgi:NTE family protein
VLDGLGRPGIAKPVSNATRQYPQDHYFLVNSLSSPPTNWDQSETPPGTVDILLKSAGTPIDAYSFEAVELLRDTAHPWRTARLVRDSAALAANTDPAVAAALRLPNAEI